MKYGSHGDLVLKKAIIKIAYDGEALKTGSMDIQELAPALLATGELLQEANRFLNEDRKKLSVKVKSDFKIGSFEIVLEAISWLKSIMASMKNFTPLEIAGLVGIVSSISGLNLLALIKWLKNRKIKNIITLENGMLRIELPDGDAAQVKKETLSLYRNK
jgi:hypothetical protein